MAIPIYETPILSRKDAENFVNRMKTKQEKRPPVDYQKIMKKVAEKAAQSGKKYL